MKILFVCTGNTCRGPMAEAIFNELNEDKSVIANSAGISAVPGSTAINYSVNILDRELKTNIIDRKAIQLKQPLLKGADIVLTMSDYSREYVKEYYSDYSNKVFTLAEYVGEKEEVVDPYGGPITSYEKTYNQINKLVDLLLTKIKEDESD